jgi:ribosomal-protein-alanine N-acetyltransferase
MMAAEKTITKVNIRWMTPKDIDEVLQIEYSSFEDAWTANEFKKCLAKKPCLSMLAYLPTGYQHKIVGYFVIEMHKTGFTLLKFAVHPDHRRQEVGTQLAAKIVSKLQNSYRVRAEVVVRDRDVGSQMFFRKVGWKGEKVLRRHFPAEEDLKIEADDGILFAYTVPPDDVGLKS